MRIALFTSSSWTVWLTVIARRAWRRHEAGSRHRQLCALLSGRLLPAAGTRRG